MHICCENKKLTPISSEQQNDDRKSVRTYIPISSKTFEVVVSIGQGFEDCRYGGRVFVDRLPEDVEGWDHEFWIGPGETSYTLNGFYEGSGATRLFRFGKLEDANKFSASTSGSCAGSNFSTSRAIQRKLEALGTIRIDWFAVEHMKKRTRDGKTKSATPAAVSIPDNVPQHLKDQNLDKAVTLPGSAVRENMSSTMAVLKDPRIFSTVAYFQTVSDLVRHYLIREASDLHAIPLPALLEVSVREACVMQMVLQVALKRYDLTECSDFDARQCGGDEELMNSPIALEDLVHSFNERLSPKAAYIVCTGNLPDEYSESDIVQENPAFTFHNKELNGSIFKQKENGMRSFFIARPNKYTCKKSQKCAGSWEVTRTVVVLELDSSSESESD
jgi:hypothetical protein